MIQGGLVRVAMAAVLLALQNPQEGDVKLPSGKSQREEILKLEHEKSLEDLARIQELAREVESELKENGYHVLSRSALQKTEDIEKLARRLKGRLRKY